MKKLVVKLGWAEQLFYEQFYPNKEIDKKALMMWAFDCVNDSTNFNQVYGLTRAIKRFFTIKQGNKNAFEINWIELINSDPELKNKWKKDIEKQKEKKEGEK